MTKSTKNKKIHKIIIRRHSWKLLTIVLFALLIASIFTGGFKDFAQPTSADSKEVVNKAISYINTNLLQAGIEAELEGIADSEIDSLYKFNIAVGGRTFPSYVTKDGKYLLPQGLIDLKEEIKEVETEPSQATDATTSCGNTPKQAKPKVAVYYMSYCPYGVQAIQGIAPAIKLLGDSVDFEPHFVIYANYRGGGPDYCLDDGKLCSMHGIAELNEDIRQLCTWKYEKSKFWDYTLCTMDDCSVGNIETCWKTCAEKNNVDVKKIEKCQAEEGVALMTEESRLNKELGVSGSPTIFVNGERYSGSRASENFKQGICCGFNEEPSECEQTLGTAAQAAAAGGCG